MKRLSHLSPVTSIVVVLGLMIEAALAQGQCYSHWAKQLTVDTGWMANCDRVFLTTDAGGTWKDITPPQAPKMSTPLYGISAVFFIDNSTGWVVMSSGYEKEAVEEGGYETITNRFFIASTNDAGANWSFQRVSTPEIDRAGTEGSHGLSENAWIQFTDAQHGVMNVGLAVGSGPGVYPAVFVSTSDGGKSWKDLGGAGAGAGDMLFTTQYDGWIEGQDGLFVTHDGAKTWKEVALPQPKKAEHDPVYLKGNMPIFPDKDHGFMVAEYRRAGDIDTTVLFSSHDGGHTWKPDKVLPRRRDSHTVFTVLDLGWRTLTLRDHKLVLSLPFASFPLASAPVDVNLAYVGDVTFLDSLHGWAIVGAEYGPTQLLSTSNAGASWNIITPPPIKGDFVEHPPHLKTGPLIWKRPTS